VKLQQNRIRIFFIFAQTQTYSHATKTIHCFANMAGTYTGWPKNWHTILYGLTLPNINRFSTLFHCQNQEKICNNTVIKDPTTPQVCRCTLHCEMSNVLKGTIDNKTTSVTTHCTKLTTGNNVFIVSIIV